MLTLSEENLKSLMQAVVLAAMFLLSLSVAAQEHASVTSCPGQAALPLAFEIDCTHVADASSKQLCRQFIENQACKVFPAYRKITGIKLENTCKQIKFTIYDDDKWPHPKGEGGLALNCAVDYLAKYSLQYHANSGFGPYDVHELLHEYQLALGALPDAHVLFASSMAEAMKEIGASQDYQQAIKNIKDEAPRVEQELRDGKVSADKQCTAAETQIDESLYLANSRSVYAYYRKLAVSKNPDMAGRRARFNRMFYLVSGPKPEVKQFLTQYCGKF